MEFQSRHKKIIPALAMLIVCFIALNTFAQDDTKTRTITSDDFASQRPKSQNAELSKKPIASKRTKINKPRRITYKFVQRNNNTFRNKSIPVTAKNRIKASTKTANKPVKISELGVTMWKLRPALTSDSGYKLPVAVNNKREMWTAERVNFGSSFKAGDRIRLAIESSSKGYLYVINSETYSDGTFGDPVLIFPSSENEDNSIQPGVLVDIPDQTEDLPYFVINPKKENYNGELLAVIVSPKPLTNLKTDQNGKIKNLENLIELEEGTETEIFSRNDNQDKLYSQAESQASCGANARKNSTRELERPCGARTRQLTREEHLPQTIYRIKVPTGQPGITFIRLNVLFEKNKN
jgi:hypothetical protein